MDKDHGDTGTRSDTAIVRILLQVGGYVHGVTGIRSHTVTVRIFLKVSDRKDIVEGEWTAHTVTR